MKEAPRARTIHLITTGGTIEKRYVEHMGTVDNREPQIRRALAMLRLGEAVIEVEELMNKDSLQMDDHDRAQVVAAVRRAVSLTRPVVITHGTDTMVQTGLAIADTLDALPAPVVLTGAMTPFGIEGSDALQNLTEALLATSLVAPGVYIAAHGEIHPIREVRKDVQTSRFLRLTPPQAP